jgi:hypothetical protein
MNDEWFSDEALRKQAKLEEGPVRWTDLIGILEPRVPPTDEECCVCCGLDARDEVGGEEHNGKRYCDICLGRGHHED